MENFVIKGGKELFGEVNISGAKNAAVAIIPAAVLADDKVKIENIPNISDVSLIIEILSQMGASIKLLSKDSIEIDTRPIKCQSVPYEFSSRFRARITACRSVAGWLDVPMLPSMFSLSIAFCRSAFPMGFSR